MVWLGPPSRGVPRPRLHDAPYPGFRLDKPPKVPLKEQQLGMRRDRSLIRVATIALAFTAAAFLVMIGVLVATHT
jgi:hypothetical protein